MRRRINFHSVKLQAASTSPWLSVLVKDHFRWARSVRIWSGSKSSAIRIALPGPPRLSRPVTTVRRRRGKGRVSLRASAGARSAQAAPPAAASARRGQRPFPPCPAAGAARPGPYLGRAAAAALNCPAAGSRQPAGGAAHAPRAEPPPLPAEGVPLPPRAHALGPSPRVNASAHARPVPPRKRGGVRP